ncbi:BIG/ATPase V1 complex, subunit S1 [Rhexocercosporidium sp. MPI-PUGE-AT-0058]|nr:BIG/ATPase V1 complex, subunit S1 [Rhexocercosporidium sp. MPI-PUGE-AT-0058]
MRLSIAALTATVTCAAAFKDTSPFLMFSDSPLPQDTKTAQLQSSTSILASAKAHLSTCPSQIYYILTQPSLRSSELSAHAPHFKSAITHPSVQGRLAVNDAVGLKVSDGDELQAFLQEKCGAEVLRLEDVRSKSAGEKMAVARESLVALKGSREKRGRMVEDLDSKLYQHLHALSTGPKYTFILLSTQPSDITPEQTTEKAIIYEPKFMEPLHMDLKRDIYARERNVSGTVDRRPLFEKYNFLSPGLFMGLLVTLLLLAILSVGISAISSLEVSYGAFDKEMGPAAQQKNKQ